MRCSARSTPSLVLTSLNLNRYCTEVRHIHTHTHTCMHAHTRTTHTHTHTHTHTRTTHIHVPHILLTGSVFSQLLTLEPATEGGREGGREKGREGEREGGRKGGRDGVRKGAGSITSIPPQRQRLSLPHYSLQLPMSYAPPSPPYP